MSIDLDDSRWSLVEQALGPGTELPSILRRIDRTRWDESSGSFSNDDPWDDLLQATYDEGTVRTGAYAVVSYLVDVAAPTRSRGEQGTLLYFVPHLVLESLEGSSDIPAWLIDEFEHAVLSLGTMAQECIESGQLGRGQRKIAVAAGVLATRQLVIASLAFGMGIGQLVVRCGHCDRALTLRFEGGIWTAGDHMRGLHPLTPHRPPRRELFTRLVELGAKASLGEEYERSPDLDATVQCHRCAAQVEVLDAVSASVRLRCPLARVKGWEL